MVYALWRYSQLQALRRCSQHWACVSVSARVVVNGNVNATETRCEYVVAHVNRTATAHANVNVNAGAYVHPPVQAPACERVGDC